MIRQPKLGYLVAEGGRARLLLRHGDGRYETLAVYSPEPAAHPRVHMEDAERERFAHRLAHALAEAVAADRLEGFVLVAPPTMLNLVRDALGSDTRRRLRGELPRDLTKLPEAELHERLNPLALMAGAAAEAD